VVQPGLAVPPLRPLPDRTGGVPAAHRRVPGAGTQPAPVADRPPPGAAGGAPRAVHRVPPSPLLLAPPAPLRPAGAGPDGRAAAAGAGGVRRPGGPAGGAAADALLGADGARLHARATHGGRRLAL